MSRKAGKKAAVGPRKITVLDQNTLKALADERGGDLEDCNITELDFSGEHFELESLDGLRYIAWRNLKALDVSNNTLDKLDKVLNKFSTFQTIIAMNNLITVVELSLPNLTEIDLSRNYLRQIPDLSGVPKLERLLLGFNEIGGGYDELSNVPNLILLDLSNNRLNFSPVELNRFIETLTGLKKLDNLRVFNNPFCDNIQQYEYYFIYRIDSLTTLNNELVTKDLKAEVKRTKLKPLEQVFKDATAARQAIQGVVDIETEKMPKLEDLHSNLQRAKNDPTQCLILFKKVSKDVENIVNRPAERFMIFKANTPEEQSAIRMHIDSFLQEAVMMIEDMPTMRTPVLRLLASLTEVEEGNFGQKCLKILQDLYVSGPEIAQEIEEILRKIIIPKIRQSKIENISKDLLKGVIGLSKDQDISDMLRDLIDTMAEWMRTEVNAEELRIVEGELEEDLKRDIHSYAIALVAATANESRNAEAMTEKRIADYTARLLKVMERETEPSNILAKQEGMKETISRLKHVLRVIENLSKNYPKSAAIFVADEIHQKLLRDIWEYLMFYKANGYTFGGGSGGISESAEMMYYKLLTSYINALAGLCKETKCVDYINTLAKEIRDEILNVSVMPKTDPVLLTAILELIYAIISSPSMIKNENANTFKHFSNSLQKLLPFLSYMGGKKYKDICILGEKYAKGTMVGQDPIIISSLTNKYLHNLFISIIQLIQFFCYKSIDGSIPKEIQACCASVSSALNANNREEYLFNCLEIPNDSVKIAVVLCLDKIPISEIDIEETGHIVRVLGSYKNLGVGRTEEVLSQIFLLLAKIVDDEEKGEDFRTKFGEMVVTECLSILHRNQIRDLRLQEDENLEKMYLTSTAVLFLKKCSMHQSLRPYLENSAVEEKTRMILKAEEQFSTAKEAPVDIERTWLGSNVEPLLLNCVGNNHLWPFSEVSFRVVQRIADVLIGAPEKELYKPQDTEENKLEALVDYNIQVNNERIKEECSAWIIPEEVTVHVGKERTHFQHQKFCQIKGITTLLTFLMGKSSLNSLELEKELTAEYDPIYEQQTLLSNISNKCSELTLEYEEQVKRADEEENRQMGMEDLNKPEKLDDTGLLMKAMEEQDIGSDAHSYAIRNNDFSIQNYKWFNAEKYMLRSRILAAFLRCIYATIEFGDLSIRLHTLEQIKHPVTLRNITKLCATTGWKYATLAAKYLRCVKHIIKLSPISNFRPKEDVVLLEIISHAVKDILVLMDIKITNRDREPLSPDDFFLLSELAALGSGICTAIGAFQWSDIIDSVYIERTSQMIKSVQEQAEAYLLEQLIPTDSIRYYVEMLFLIMTSNERLVQNSYKKTEKEMVYIDMAKDFIGNIMGTYIAISEDSKYRVLEFCKIGEIFEKKVFNPTYLQEILNRSSTILFGSELAKLMKRKYLEYKLATEQLERVTAVVWTDMGTYGSNSIKKMLILVTSTCLHLLNPCTQPPCPLCGEERFCPAPPTYEVNIQFSEITKIVYIPQFPQFVAIRYGSKMLMFITKSISGGKTLGELLSDVKTELSKSREEEEGYAEEQKEPEYQEDKCFTDSLENYLFQQDKGEVKLMMFASFNPNKPIPFQGLKIHINGTLFVVTTKSLLLVMNVYFKHWEFFNPDNIKKTDDEELANIPKTLVKNGLFTIVKEIDLGKSSNIVIPRAGEFKFIIETDSKYTFQFGDDLALEIFQRNVMRDVYKLKGGQKVKEQDKKGKRRKK